MLADTPVLEADATDELLAGADDDGGATDDDAGATEDEAGAWLELLASILEDDDRGSADEDAGATEDDAGVLLELAIGAELGFTLLDPPPPPPHAVNNPPIANARSNLDVFINRSLLIILFNLRY